MSASDTETKRFRSEQQQQPLFEELITEILSWLPLESLIRFKCVSKSWNSLISDPSFIQLHSHRSSELPRRRLIVRLEQHDTRYVLGSCNGLVCLLGSDSSDKDKYGQQYSHFRLWNPATRLISKKFSCFCLLEPKPGSLKFGFGYDKSSHTYKVVCLRYEIYAVNDSDRTQVKVYTFGDGVCWRGIQSFPGYPFHIQTEGTFLSGTLNWVAIRNFVTGREVNFDDVAIHRYVIVSLDLRTETYKQFSLPPFGHDEMPDNPRPFDAVIEIFLDCLCLSYDCKGTHFIMWQMKEFGVEKSWTRFVKVSYHHLQIRGGLRWMAPLCILENGDVLILRKNYNEIILYNRRDNVVQLASAPIISNKSLEIYVKGYAPTLVSPYKITSSISSGGVVLAS